MHAVLQGDPHSTAQHVRMASIVASCTSHDAACAGLTAREGRCSGCRLAWIYRQALAVCCGAVARPEREGCVLHMHAPRRRQCGMPDLHVAMVTGHHCRRRSEGRSQQGSAGIHRSMRSVPLHASGPLWDGQPSSADVCRQGSLPQPQPLQVGATILPTSRMDRHPASQGLASQCTRLPEYREVDG